MGLGTDTPTWLSTSERQIRDTLNLVRGRHTIRMGGEIPLESQFNLFQINSPARPMSFHRAITRAKRVRAAATDCADLLLGIPLTSYIDTPVYLGDRQHVPSLFIQDDFKVGSQSHVEPGPAV